MASEYCCVIISSHNIVSRIVQHCSKHAYILIIHIGVNCKQTNTIFVDIFRIKNGKNQIPQPYSIYQIGSSMKLFI